jgi:hypothetical protein
MRLRIVLQELVLNAMEHGNLHVSSEEKNQALLNDQYEELLAERRASPHFRSLRVRLTMNHDVLAGSIRFQICDEGEGFDWQRILGREPQDLPMTAGAGRGIFLVRALIQDVAYIGKGNEVVFTIRYDPLSH